MGGCQNYGLYLGTLNIRCRIILGTQKGTIVSTTTHVAQENLEMQEALDPDMLEKLTTLKTQNTKADFYKTCVYIYIYIYIHIYI